MRRGTFYTLNRAPLPVSRLIMECNGRREMDVIDAFREDPKWTCLAKDVR